MRKVAHVLGVTVPLMLCLIALPGCGGGGSTVQVLEFGYRQPDPAGAAENLTATPSPDLGTARLPLGGGTSPRVVIDTVTAYNGTVHADGTDIYEQVSQFATGRAAGVDPTKTRLCLYTLTDKAYIQPLDHAYSWLFVPTAPGATSAAPVWYGPVHDGHVLVLLISDTYVPPQAFPLGSPPPVDGLNVLAVATQ